MQLLTDNKLSLNILEADNDPPAVV